MQIFDSVFTLSLAKLWFRSITYEGMQQFHSNFTEGQNIISTGQVRIWRSLQTF